MIARASRRTAANCGLQGSDEGVRRIDGLRREEGNQRRSKRSARRNTDAYVIGSVTPRAASGEDVMIEGDGEVPSCSVINLVQQRDVGGDQSVRLVITTKSLTVGPIGGPEMLWPRRRRRSREGFHAARRGRKTEGHTRVSKEKKKTPFLIPRFATSLVISPPADTVGDNDTRGQRCCAITCLLHHSAISSRHVRRGKTVNGPQTVRRQKQQYEDVKSFDFSNFFFFLFRRAKHFYKI